MAVITDADKTTLRVLGEQIANAAADPINKKRRAIHAAVDCQKPIRPSITIFQEPWSELSQTGELDLECSDAFCRGIESDMRRTLYKWNHYPADMVIERESVQQYCLTDTGFGISENTDIVRTDRANDVVSRHFHIQIKDEADIDKIKPPVVTYDSEKTEELFQIRSEIFDGILPVKKRGVTSIWFAPWDELVRWTGVQEVLMDLALRPDYVHKLIGHLVDCHLARMEQMKNLGAYERPPEEMSVTGAAQIFSEVSPQMHRAFALEHEARFYSHFKRVHYGCCEPLHNKVDVCAEMLPNMYQISMSPWVDHSVGAKNVGNRFIYGWRPNPAHLAFDNWEPELVRDELMDTLKITQANGCTVAIYLKDISTVRNEPSRIDKWERIAKECVNEFAS